MRAHTHPYRLPLIRPLVLKGTEHSERRGVLLRLEDDRGRTGWGDCAPLPGFSSEDLAEAAGQLDDLGPWLRSRRPQPEWGDPAHPIHQEIAELRLLPSTRYALELALLDLAAQTAGVPLPQLLDPNASEEIRINALVVGDDEATVDRIAALLAGGYEVIKLKVGRRDASADARLVAAVRRTAGPDVAIVCDANQAWTMAEAMDFAEGVLGLGIDYVEEPLRDPADLGLLWARSGPPIALDESLMAMAPADLVSKAFASAAVLKPTLLGGIFRTMEFAAEARAATIEPVVSSALESGVGMRGNAAIAAAIRSRFAGLDPYTMLAEDVLAPRLPLDRPTVGTSAVFEPRSIRSEAEGLAPSS